jgi:hypothetical protein
LEKKSKTRGNTTRKKGAAKNTRAIFIYDLSPGDNDPKLLSLLEPRLSKGSALIAAGIRIDGAARLIQLSGFRIENDLLDRLAWLLGSAVVCLLSKKIPKLGRYELPMASPTATEAQQPEIQSRPLWYGSLLLACC